MAARARRLVRHRVSWPALRLGVAVLMVLAAVAAGCGQAAPPPDKARRIVSLVPAVTEMLFAIGAGPQIVGVSSYDHFPPEVEALPKVGALLDPDTERILSLRPDLVVVYGSQTDVDAHFKKAGIRTFNYRHGGKGAILALTSNADRTSPVGPTARFRRRSTRSRRSARPRATTPRPARWSPE